MTDQQIVAELRLRAWQERASARIGRKSKAFIAEHEHAAQALESLANDIERGVWATPPHVPAHLPLSAVDALEEQSIDARIAEAYGHE